MERKSSSSELSGSAAKVAMAGIINDPPIILADEPTEFSTKSGREIMKY